MYFCQPVSKHFSLNTVCSTLTPHPDNVNFLKTFHFEESPRCTSHEHVFFISFLRAELYVKYICMHVCLCKCVHICVSQNVKM